MVDPGISGPFASILVLTLNLSPWEEGLQTSPFFTYSCSPSPREKHVLDVVAGGLGDKGCQQFLFVQEV